ncbi:MAG: hypothetical protein U1E37_09300 [Sphingomonadaceae bacterium]
MNLPKFDLSALPDLDTLTGMLGSLSSPDQRVQIIDDSLIDVMVYVYEVIKQLLGT